MGRVFTGDSRPAMMSRDSHVPTLASPQPSPSSDQQSPPNQLPARRLSIRQPLLHFDSNGDLREAERISKSKSVFGVDQLWEREMEKLKKMEEQNAEIVPSAKVGKDRKGKGKEKVIEPIQSNHRLSVSSRGSERFSPVKRIGELPPTLAYSPERSMPALNVPALSENQPRRAASRLGVGGWFGSSDEEEEEQRLVRRKRDKGKKKQVQVDSEDEIPLSRIIPRSTSTSTAGLALAKADSDSDSEEDVPLSRLRSPNPVKSPAVEDEDDDVPLGLRIQTPARGREEIEDDLPLGYKHAPAALRQQATGRSGMMGWASPGQVFPMSPFPMWGSPMAMPMPMGYPMNGMAGLPSMGVMPGMEMGMPMPMSGMEAGMLPVPGQGPEGRIDNWRREVLPGRVLSGSSAIGAAATG